MKRFIVLCLTLVMIFSFAGCLRMPVEKPSDLKVDIKDDNGNIIGYEQYTNDIITEKVFFNRDGNAEKRIEYSDDGKETGYVMYFYDGQGRVTNSRYYTADGTYKYENIIQYDGEGNTLSEKFYIEESGYYEERVYPTDSHGMLIKYFKPDVTEVHEYSENNKIYKSFYYKPDAAIDDLPYEWRDYQYDNKGNLIKSYIYNSDNELIDTITF